MSTEATGARPLRAGVDIGGTFTDVILYDVTVEDPGVLTTPWHEHEIFRLRPGERLREYECIENNEDIVRWEKLLDTEFKK